jgi:4-carboxymuconolactone decarboxylase
VAVNHVREGPRIDPVARPSSEQRELLSKVPARADGRTRNIFLTLLHHPLLLKRFNAFAGTFIRFGSLPADEREAIILRVATRTGCRYELAQHLPLARDTGLDDDTILAIVGEPMPVTLEGRHQLLMSVTDELLAEGGISDERWSALADQYETPALLELICLVGFYRLTADLLNVVGVELEEEIDVNVRSAADGLRPESPRRGASP